MVGTLPTRGFISYSRTDSDFVDRLEADLRARGFETWVDRRRLEGAQNWEQEIFRGIDWCSLMIVVLSPAAAVSSAVEQEWRYALSKNKLIIPLIWQVCTIPSDLEKLKRQWVAFYNVGYAACLKNLLIAIPDFEDQRTSLPTDSRELYKQAIEARQRGDLERTAILLQRLVDREPGYANGEAAHDLASVNDRLYAGRAQRLRQEATDARRKGEYGREAGALEALVALGPKDAWADEYLPIAQRNRQQLDLYDAIQGYIDAGDLAEAKAKLSRLWVATPYFGDPANLAPRLGLAVPRTYEEDKERQQRLIAEERERQQASDWKRQAEATAKAELDHATTSKKTQWNELLSAPTGDDRELVQYRQYKQQVDILQEKANKLLRMKDFPDIVVEKAAPFIKPDFFVWVGFAIVVALAYEFHAPGWLTIAAICVSVSAAALFGLFILSLPIMLLIRMPVHITRKHHERQAAQARKQAKYWYDQWRTRREPEHERQIQQLQEVFQQHMAEIEVEYQQRLDSIARKYAASR